MFVRFYVTLSQSELFALWWKEILTVLKLIKTTYNMQ